MLGWVAGCLVIWSALFMVGNLLYGRYAMALVLLGAFDVGGLTLLRVMNRLWAARPVAQAVAQPALEEGQPR